METNYSLSDHQAIQLAAVIHTAESSGIADWADVSLIAASDGITFNGSTAVINCYDETAYAVLMGYGAGLFIDLYFRLGATAFQLWLYDEKIESIDTEQLKVLIDCFFEPTGSDMSSTVLAKPTTPARSEVEASDFAMNGVKSAAVPATRPDAIGDKAEVQSHLAQVTGIVNKRVFDLFFSRLQAPMLRAGEAFFSFSNTAALFGQQLPELLQEVSGDIAAAPVVPLVAKSVTPEAAKVVAKSTKTTAKTGVKKTAKTTTAQLKPPAKPKAAGAKKTKNANGAGRKSDKSVGESLDRSKLVGLVMDRNLPDFVGKSLQRLQGTYRPRVIAALLLKHHSSVKDILDFLLAGVVASPVNKLVGDDLIMRKIEAALRVHVSRT